MSNQSRNIKPTISQPVPDLGSLTKVAGELKEAVEVMSGQRGEATAQAVTWDDLLRLGLAKPWDVPK